MADRSLPLRKVVLIGEPAVGKTSIRRNFMGEAFNIEYMSTIGTEISFYASDRMNLSIWDLAGEPNYKSVRGTYYRGAHGIIAVFDLTRRETLPVLSNWFAEVFEILSDRTPIVIAANKLDLIDQNTDDIEDINEFITDLQDTYQVHPTSFFTSAKTGDNIKALFDVLMTMMED